MAEQMADEKLIPEEIIEWVVANALYVNPHNKQWQAKLKEWRAQLAKADKARPADREKIKELVRVPPRKTDCPYSPYDKDGKHYDPFFRKSVCDDCFADQILSLLNPEVIRREVAEEIIKEAEDGGYVILLESGQALVASTFGEWWQSLKSRLGGENEKRRTGRLYHRFGD